MTLKQFSDLDEMQQAELLWKHAPLEFRTDETFKYLLYQIESFYVEVRYHKQHNLLTGLWAFDSTAELEPYLAQINFTGGLLAPRRYSIEELTREALEILPEATIEQIRKQDKERLIDLHPSVGRLIRTELGLWQRKVEDEHGMLIHPDDVSFAIIKQVNSTEKTS